MRSATCCHLLLFAVLGLGRGSAPAQEAKSAVVATFQGTCISEEDVRKAAADDLEKLDLPVPLLRGAGFDPGPGAA